MSDTTPEATPAPDADEPTENPAPPTDSEPDTGAGQDSGQSEDDLPDWAKAELSRARREAGGYRTKLREAEERLSNATDPEEAKAAIAAAQSELETVRLEATRERLARRYNLPDDLVEQLDGLGEEAMEKRAKVLAKYLPGVHREADLPPKESRLDPSALADQVGRRRR